MSDKVCSEYYSAQKMYILFNWSFVSWALLLVVATLMENFMKLVLVSHTAFSRWVYITCLHGGTLPLLISLKTLHFLKMCVLFFSLSLSLHRGRPCRLTTSENNVATEKWLPPRRQALRPTISTHFSVNPWGQMDMLRCCFITTIMTNWQHTVLKERGYPPFKQQWGRYTPHIC